MLQYLGKVNPLVCNSVLEEVADEDAFFVADGGDQVELLKDSTGCMLAHTNYHEVAKGLGAEGAF